MDGGSRAAEQVPDHCKNTLHKTLVSCAGLPCLPPRLRHDNGERRGSACAWGWQNVGWLWRAAARGERSGAAARAKPLRTAARRRLAPQRQRRRSAAHQQLLHCSLAPPPRSQAAHFAACCARADASPPARHPLFAQAAAATEEAGTKKLWGGRFTGKTDPLMEKFNESLPVDKRMWAEDIQVRFVCSSPMCVCCVMQRLG